ncbi:MAG: bifunctional precorrin-2 dehydrogenase/sirohydrochlorin ferrochelatase [Acidobacteria bacterium]|nr:bifunctional precorrin-2 dehydrogenase/sirohydrochlorin ferrochelatase [Acidobacteriota bacterium]
MRYYPLFFDLQGRCCVVIGQGRVADQKALLLQQAGGEVMRSTCFDPDQAAGAHLIVAVVDSDEDAARLQVFAEQKRILLNVVDRPQYSNFIAPALVESGDLVIAISTSGKSPALAAQIRDELEQQFGPEYEIWLDWLGALRPRVREMLPDFEQRRELYHRLLTLNWRERLRIGDKASLKQELGKLLEQAVNDLKQKVNS